MGSVVSQLAFPAPPKELSQFALLKRGGGGGGGGGDDGDGNGRARKSSSNNKEDGGDGSIGSSSSKNGMNQLVYLTTESGYRIPAVHLRRRGPRAEHQQHQQDGQEQKQEDDDDRLTLIYSHGNAEDVGLCLPYLDYLSHLCDCHVLAYEYCGYSVAGGDASERNCYECIQAAYAYLVQGGGGGGGGGIPPSRIVLFGRSLGTGPTVDLAARLCGGGGSAGPGLGGDDGCCGGGGGGCRPAVTPHLLGDGSSGFIAGCILQSPLESAGRCVLGETASALLYPFDLFRNYEKIGMLAPIPVFIMHGRDDRVVPFCHGRTLHAELENARRERYGTGSGGGGSRDDSAAVPNTNRTVEALAYPPLWIPSVGHNDMPELQCIQAVGKFLGFVRLRQRRNDDGRRDAAAAAAVPSEVGSSSSYTERGCF